MFFLNRHSCVDYACSVYPRLPNMMDETAGSVCGSVTPWKEGSGSKKKIHQHVLHGGTGPRGGLK